MGCLCRAPTLECEEQDRAFLGGAARRGESLSCPCRLKEDTVFQRCSCILLIGYFGHGKTYVQNSDFGLQNEQNE